MASTAAEAAASSLLWLFCLTLWVHFVTAGDLATLNLCKPKQSRINFEENVVELKTVPVFKYGNELLENRFRFQKRSDAFGCQEGDSVDLAKIEFTAEGYVSIEKEIQVRNVTQMAFVWFAPSEFCIEASDEKRLQAVRLLNCNKEPTLEELTVMVPKCCPPGYAVGFHMWDSRNHEQCVPVPAEQCWVPKFYDQKSFDGNFCVSPLSKDSRPKYRFYTKPHENQSVWYSLGPKRPLNDEDGILTDYRLRWRLMDNGSFAQPVPSRNKWYPYDRWRVNQAFCGDMLVNISGPGNPESVEFIVIKIANPEYVEPKNSTEPIASEEVGTTTLSDTPDLELTTPTEPTATEVNDFLVPEGEEQPYNPKCQWTTVAITYVVCYFLSAPFLLLTIAAFLLTKKSQTVYGWTMLSHLVTFLLMNVAFGMSLWMTACLELSTAKGFCTFIGFAVTFLFLSVYVWLTCVNFDLWWTFRKIRSVSKRRSLVRYYIYAAISIGVPLAFTLTGYILDTTYGEFGIDSDCLIILTDFGLTKCYLSEGAEGPYLYYPLLILLFLNMIFFLLTASTIYGVRESTKLVRKPTEGIDKDAILLFGKLFIVMGTSCIFEFISWFAQPELVGQAQQNLAFVIIDVINYLGRSIVIFLIFGCKKQVRVEVRRLLVQWGVLSITPGMSSQASAVTQSSVMSTGSTSEATDGATSSGGAMKMKTFQASKVK